MLFDIDELESFALTKVRLSQRLFDVLGTNKRECQDLVEGFFDVIFDELVAGHDVKISGFGNFHVRGKASRPGRNPRTGVNVGISERHVVTFHASVKLKQQVQGEALQQ